MFLIKENKFISDGRVKYEDEFGNKLMILAEKNGLSFKVKCRPAIGYDIDVIHMNFPYEVAGVHFKFSASEEIEISNAEKAMLKEVVRIIENWVCMMSNIATLVNCNIAQLATYVPNESNQEKAAVKYTEYLISELEQYQEMEHFTKLYKTIMASKTPAADLSQFAKNMQNN